MTGSPILFFFRKPAAHAALAFLVALVAVFIQIRGHWHIPPYADSVSYLAVAVPLHDEGVITDGNYPYDAVGQGPKGEGMFFAPLYPAFLSVLMSLSPDFNKTAHCVKEHRRPKVIVKECQPLHLGPMIVTHVFLAALAGMLAWLSAFTLTGRMALAWLAMILVLATKEYASNTVIIMTENLIFPLFTLATLLFIQMWRKRNLRHAVAAGVALALLALTRPAFTYLFYFAAVVMIPLAATWWLRKTNLRLALLSLLFILSYAAAVSPWIIRNGLKIGVWDISAGYGAFTLVQRVAFNDMTMPEWLATFTLSLPDFGDRLTMKLFSYDDIKRLDLNNPDGFYNYGNRVLREQEKAEAGGPARFQSHLIKKYILADPLKHVWTTLPMTWKGLWVGGNLSFLFIPAFCVFFMLSALRRQWLYVMFATAPWFMLGLHGFTSVNITRYNLILLPCLSIAAAWAVLALVARLKTLCWKLFKKREAAA